MAIQNYLSYTQKFRFCDSSQVYHELNITRRGHISKILAKIWTKYMWYIFKCLDKSWIRVDGLLRVVEMWLRLLMFLFESCFPVYRTKNEAVQNHYHNFQSKPFYSIFRREKLTEYHNFQIKTPLIVETHVYNPLTSINAAKNCENEGIRTIFVNFIGEGSTAIPLFPFRLASQFLRND